MSKDTRKNCTYIKSIGFIPSSIIRRIQLSTPINLIVRDIPEREKYLHFCDSKTFNCLHMLNIKMTEWMWKIVFKMIVIINQKHLLFG